MEFDKAALAAANSVCPAALWKELGYKVITAGSRELRVLCNGHALYRSVLLADGRWLSGMADAGMGIAPHVGDNVSVARYFLHLTFKEALEKLSGLSQDKGDLDTWAKKASSIRRRAYPFLPPTSPEAEAEGTRYLTARGISHEIIKKAVNTGFLSFTEAVPEKFGSAVTFIGYDGSGKCRLVSKRLTGECGKFDCGVKYDMKGSCKEFVPIFHGEPDRVVFTEGGVNALSILQLNLDAGLPLPTVVMTCGVGNIRCLEGDVVRQAVLRAKAIWLVGENDFLHDGSPNIRANENRIKMLAAAEDVSGKKVILNMPPENQQDINDWLIYKTKKQALEKSDTQKKVEEQSLRMR